MKMVSGHSQAAARSTPALTLGWKATDNQHTKPAQPSWLYTTNQHNKQCAVISSTVQMLNTLILYDTLPSRCLPWYRHDMLNSNVCYLDREIQTAVIIWRVKLQFLLPHHSYVLIGRLVVVLPYLLLYTVYCMGLWFWKLKHTSNEKFIQQTALNVIYKTTVLSFTQWKCASFHKKYWSHHTTVRI